ncbi:MAG: trans-aconitate 2-methyltransferase [Acidobacteriales bacterium]|nr:trans-aconitate 2-methyltransferase [Terriglobales bacterium]
MPTWDANLYLKFSDERARPCADLIARIALENPTHIVDLGCGPGNSTEQLHQRWPRAEVLGLDSSAEMLCEARKNHPDWKWEQADLAAWKPARTYDLIFSNATLHWVKDHARILPQLFAHVAPGGALAVQMPQHNTSPAHRAMVDVSREPEWAPALDQARQTITIENAGFYYDVLSPLASRLDLWETTYHPEMENAEAVLTWMRGSGMRPYLEAFSAEQQKRFQQACLERFHDLFPARANGKILLPYPRIFLIAYR